MAKYNNNALLGNDTVSKMMHELFAKGYSKSELAKRLGTSTASVKAIYSCDTSSISNLNSIQIRLIDVFCQTK